MSLKEEITKMARECKEASNMLATLSTKAKNDALLLMAECLDKNAAFIKRKNREDVKTAKAKKVSRAFIDRLTLNDRHIAHMADSLREIARLDDPVGEIIHGWTRPNGLRIEKQRVPIGVICIIYESRPNVTSDCVGLCLKSGNGVILRGGAEAIKSNTAIYEVLKNAMRETKLPKESIGLVQTISREAVDILLKLERYIDLVIPRGGESLIKKVTEQSKIPVIKHYKGICHVYVDEDADLNMAEKIAFNAKVQRPGVCNAMETLLVHKDVAARFLPSMVKKFKDAGVEIRGCELTRTIVKDIRAATQKDWSTEYLDLIVSVKVVNDLREAITHINHFGSQHSDAIVTDNLDNARTFSERVNSACVYVNASTRFTDGGEFGMGAEIGISTEKLHARGPMGLEELTTYKYIILGSGQIRE